MGFTVEDVVSEHLNDFAVMFFTSPRSSTDLPSMGTFQEVAVRDIDFTVVPSIDA
jgi:hypothetical protein